MAISAANCQYQGDEVARPKAIHKASEARRTAVMVLDSRSPAFETASKRERRCGNDVLLQYVQPHLGVCKDRIISAVAPGNSGSSIAAAT